MDETQARVFQMFVALGRERSLVDLASLCVQKAIDGASLSTLKRWSAQFEWFDLAQFVSQEISSRLMEDMKSFHVERAKKDLETIAILKERFYARAKIDPTDAAIPQEVRDRAVDITLNDFLTLIKTERLILGDPTERKENLQIIEHKYSQDDLERAAAALAESRYKLPPARATVQSVENAD